MRAALRSLDSVLRGEATAPSRLPAGELDIPLPSLTALVVALGAFYGFCMGWSALFNRDEPAYAQVAASTVKAPALFLLTLLVTFPSLYVFNALVGSRLRGAALLRLLVAALAVTLAVLASFGPIVAFFAVTTTSYPFMVLLNVAVCAVAGALGLAFLLQTMNRIAAALEPDPPVVILADAPPAAAPPPAAPPGALDRVPGSVLGRNVKLVFVCWVVVFGLVGAQMSWVLRPFIGSPDRPFEWFRYRESNFFEAVGRSLVELFR